MTLSSQFVALSAAKPAQNVATSVTTFYLSQQIGFMAGITFSESLIRSSLENRLIAEFGNSIRGHKVGYTELITYSRKLMMFYIVNSNNTESSTIISLCAPGIP